MPKVFVLDIVERASCSSEKSCSTGFRSSFHELVIVQLQFLSNLIEFYYRLLWALFEFYVNLGGKYLSIMWLDFTYQSYKRIDDIIKCEFIKEVLIKIISNYKIFLGLFTIAFLQWDITTRVRSMVDSRKKRETLKIRMFRYENKS